MSQASMTPSQCTLQKPGFQGDIQWPSAKGVQSGKPKAQVQLSSAAPPAEATAKALCSCVSKQRPGLAMALSRPLGRPEGAPGHPWNEAHGQLPG